MLLGRIILYTLKQKIKKSELGFYYINNSFYIYYVHTTEITRFKIYRNQKTKFRATLNMKLNSLFLNKNGKLGNS